MKERSQEELNHKASSPNESSSEQKEKKMKNFFENAGKNFRNTSKMARFRAVAKLLALLIIVIGIPVLILLRRPEMLSNDYWSNLSVRLKSHPYIGGPILILLQVIQILICFLPGQPIQFASSYLYGILGGLLISIVGAVIGTTVTYYLADFLGRDFVHLIFGKEKVEESMRRLNSRRAYGIIFLIYLIPGIPKDLMSYVAGISDVEWKPFLAISTLGRLPGVSISLTFGFFIAERNYIALAVIAVLMVILLAICFKKRRWIMDRIETLAEEQTEKQPRRRKRSK